MHIEIWSKHIFQRYFDRSQMCTFLNVHVRNSIDCQYSFRSCHFRRKISSADSPLAPLPLAPETGAMAPSGTFEDTPAWEAGLRVHEAENKWLLRETLAMLSASKNYAKSLEGRPNAFDLGVDSLGGVLGALTSAGAGAPGSASAEANFAAALERVGHHATTVDDEEMSAPMAAAIGAPLLTPIADTLRAVGMLRESLGRRVHRALVGNLQAFIDEDLGSVATMRTRYEVENNKCDAARRRFLACANSRPSAQATAAKELASAKESLEVARARVSLAQVALEGRRRYVLLESARQTTSELTRFFAEASAAMSGIETELRDMEEYEMASRAQAEMKMEIAARSMQQAFDGLADGSGGGDAADGGDANAIDDEWDQVNGDSATPSVSVGEPATRNAPVGMNSGRSADLSIRQSLANGVEALRTLGDGAGSLGVGVIRKGYLTERNPGKFGGWTRRYFVLDGAGRFFVHGRGHTKKTARKVNTTSSGTESTSAGEAEKQNSLRRIGAGIGAAFSSVTRAAVPDPPGRFGYGSAPLEATDDAVLCMDLTVSCVKPGADPNDRSDRGYCFRVVSPAGSLTLQAESQREANEWVSDLQGVIAELIAMGPRNPSFPHRKNATSDGSKNRETDATSETVTSLEIRQALGGVAGNNECADCGAKDPDWASLNLCVVVCQRCAGAHRHLGAHVSKVRSLSLDLDAWTPSIIALLAQTGNGVANDFWEASRRVGTVAPKVLRLEAAIKEGKDTRGLSGKEPEHPPPVAFDSVSSEEVLAAVTRKYKNRTFVKRATIATPTFVEAAFALDVAKALERVVRSSQDVLDADATKKELKDGLREAVSRGEQAAPLVALMLMHGASVANDVGDGAGGDGDDGGGGGGGGKTVIRLDVARVAQKAGCPVDGNVFALLRAAAETQGVPF